MYQVPFICINTFLFQTCEVLIYIIPETLKLLTCPVTQVVNGRAGIQMQAVCLHSPCH